MGKIDYSKTRNDVPHQLRQYEYPIVEDDFSAANAEWEAADTHVDATFTVSGGDVDIVTGTNYTTSCWVNRNARCRNISIYTTLKDAADLPQIHLRETNEDDFLVVYIDSSAGDFRIARVDNGGITVFEDTAAISGFSTSNVYQLVGKTFNDHLLGIVLDSSGEIIYHLTFTGQMVMRKLGTANGLGSNGTSEYSDYESRKLTSYTNIVCLGDSNTEGYPAGGAYATDFGKTYPMLMQTQFLKEGVTVVNSGISGDKTTDISARLTTDLNNKYVSGARNICTLLVGTNDFAAAKTVADTWEDYEDLIRRILESGWEVWVMTYFAKNGDATRNGYLRSLNQLIRENSDSFGYRVIDLWTLFADPSDDDDVISGYLQADNLHLTDTGHQVVANTLIGLIALPDTENIQQKNIDLYGGGLGKPIWINGNFNIWQRGTSFSSPSDGDFFADRYQLKRTGFTPPTVTVSRQTATLGVGNFGHMSDYYMRVAFDGAGSAYTSGAYYLVHQKIENGVKMYCGLGRKITISFMARSDVSGKLLGVYADQQYGGGSTADVLIGPVIALTPEWKRHTVILDTTTLAGKTFGAGISVLRFGFMLAWGSSIGSSYMNYATQETFGGSGYIDMAQIQVDPGYVARPFRANTFASDLEDCKRYYQKSFPYDVAPAQNVASYAGCYGYKQPNSPTTYLATISLTPTMATTPSIVTYNPYAAATGWRNATDSTNTGVAYTEIEPTQFIITKDLDATDAQDNMYIHWTADAEL